MYCDLRRKSKCHREQPGQQPGSKEGREVVCSEPGKQAACHRAQPVARAMGSHGGFLNRSSRVRRFSWTAVWEQQGCIGMFVESSHTPGLQIRKSWSKEAVWLTPGCTLIRGRTDSQGVPDSTSSAAFREATAFRDCWSPILGGHIQCHWRNGSNRSVKG